MLAAVIAISLSLSNPDPRLESYSLDAEILVQDAPGSESSENDPSLWWRMTGWGVYLACGSIPVSALYRQDRSGWEPNGPDNAALSASIFGSAAMATNVLSEKIRDGIGKSDAAWAARLTTLGACIWQSGWNFNQGWKRQ